MNIAEDLYQALVALKKEYCAFVNTVTEGHSDGSIHPVVIQATETIAEYEFLLGPLPDWAVAHNSMELLVKGAQLCTKDGRRTGNAHIIDICGRATDQGDVAMYKVLTDAGNEMVLEKQEITSMFYIGKYISDVNRVKQQFGGKNNEQDSSTA